MNILFVQAEETRFDIFRDILARDRCAKVTIVLLVSFYLDKLLKCHVPDSTLAL